VLVILLASAIGVVCIAEWLPGFVAKTRWHLTTSIRSDGVRHEKNDHWGRRYHADDRER
jgi:hypothetical protein